MSYARRTIRVKELGTGEYINGILAIGVDSTPDRSAIELHSEVEQYSQNGKIIFDEELFPGIPTQRTFSFFDPKGRFKTVTSWIMKANAWDYCVLLEKK